MKWEVLNIKGEKVGNVDLPSDIYELEMNEPVLHTVVKAQLANKRQGTHATKTRSMVSGTGKKPFRQKGTGNARQGSSRSPLMPGGATLHGPQPRDYRQKVNSKVRELALKVALSEKVRHKKLIVLDDFALSSFSTKHVLNCLKSLKIEGTALFADNGKNEYLYRSARNIHGANATDSNCVNLLEILGHESLVLSESAVKALQLRFERNA